MAVNWTKKKSATLKWFGAGPGYLLYQIFLQNNNLFNNGMVEGILLCAFTIVLPGAAVFLLYWPTTTETNPSVEPKSND